MPPFNLVIGNAKATKLVFLGQSVDLAAYAKNNVARVRLE
jgi:cytoskeleton protein RodZ